MLKLSGIAVYDLAWDSALEASYQHWRAAPNAALFSLGVQFHSMAVWGCLEVNIVTCINLSVLLLLLHALRSAVPSHIACCRVLQGASSPNKQVSCLLQLPLTRKHAGACHGDVCC